MNTCTKNPFLLPALLAGLSLISASRGQAQTFTNLHNFTNAAGGANPSAGLLLSGDTLYGTAQNGGSASAGNVFAINVNGSGFTNLHSFTATAGSPATNSEGAAPRADLILSGNTLYGVAAFGGTTGNGSVFKLNTNGSGFTNLHNFSAIVAGTNGDGSHPYGPMLLSGNILYGTAYYAGAAGGGTIFAINTDGSGFSNLHNLNYGSDGAIPRANLVLSGNTLYGIAYGAGGSGYGTVFKLNTSGTGFTVLHSFTSLVNSTNSDGANPIGGLTLSGSILYGTAGIGGKFGKGSVFKVNTDGSGFTNLHSFAATNGPAPATNTDGAVPYGTLILLGNTLYGTTSSAGGGGNGTVFSLTTNGTGFAVVHDFTATPAPYTNTDGAVSYAGLTVSSNTLYGVAAFGGSSANGTVFKLSLPQLPQLTLVSSGANMILSWPAAAAGFGLQSTTNPALPNSWSPVAPASVTNNGQISVTVPTPLGQEFFRLKLQ